MNNDRERIINFYVELNRSLEAPKWVKLSDKDKKHIRNALSILTVDVLNGCLFTVAVEDSLTWIGNKTKVDTSSLRSLLTKPPQIYKLIKQLNVINDERKNITTFKLMYTEIDILYIDVPLEKGLELMRYPEKELISMVERYYILQPNGSIFWSSPPEMYKFLSIKDDECIEVVEGFGSPLNNCEIDAYCSIYDDDKVFGSIGNFFDQISTRGNINDMGYRRWLINPPFTRKIMDMVYEAVTSRMNYYPKDEFYFILPYWAPIRLLDLLETRGTVMELKPGSYRLYNHLTGEYFKPPVELIFASLKADDTRLADASIFMTMSYIDIPMLF